MSKRKLRLFLVEDHLASAQAIRAYLQVLGHEVEIAGDLASARKRAGEIKFDLLICDLRLPDGTGWDLLEWLREKSAVPAIAISGFGQPADVARSKAVGFAEHLVKPINPEELMASIERAIGDLP